MHTIKASTAQRSYRAAIDVLNTRRRGSRPSQRIPSLKDVSDGLSNLGGTSDLRGKPSIAGMQEWLLKLGHTTADIARLNIVHVAGTKGKGSTCAFISSLLSAHGRRVGFPEKIGLYTSPHLIFPEERIRINSEPLQRDLFAKYFFEVADKLGIHDVHVSETQPRYLQLCLLLAIHTFIREGVDATILETHQGGEYDATNFVQSPVVTAITSIGMDHIHQLGPSIENIAWHKAGIMKHGASAFALLQETSVAEVLMQRAHQKEVNLQFVDIDPELPQEEPNLKPDVQKLNCSIALAVSRSFLALRAPPDTSFLSPADISDGICRFAWPGRFQNIIEGSDKWYLDGAHNEMSITKIADWFLQTSADQQQEPGCRRDIASKTSRSDIHPRLLIFGHVNNHRDAVSLMRSLADTFREGDIDTAIFTIFDPSQDLELATNPRTKPADLANLQNFAEIWSRAFPASRVITTASVSLALDAARNIGQARGGMQTLITGSLHLVGEALLLLNQVSRSASA